MSDTPRTDAEESDGDAFGINSCVSDEFARQLERELNDWRRLCVLQNGILQACDTDPEWGVSFAELRNEAASLYKRLNEKVDEKP